MPTGQPIHASPVPSLHVPSSFRFPSRVLRRQWNRFALLAYAQLTDDFAVTICIVCLEVIQQPPALAHQHQQAAARSMILRMGFEMLGQLANALAEDRDLHFRTSGVGVMRAKTRDNVNFSLGCQHGVCDAPVSYSIHFLSVCIKSNMEGFLGATERAGFRTSFPALAYAWNLYFGRRSRRLSASST